MITYYVGLFNTVPKVECLSSEGVTRYVSRGGSVVTIAGDVSVGMLAVKKKKKKKHGRLMVTLERLSVSADGSLTLNVAQLEMSRLVQDAVPPSTRDSWDGLQQSPAPLSAGEALIENG